MIPRSGQGRHALSLDRVRAREARDPAQRRASRMRDASGGGLRAREVQGDGLRDDHGPRHDRRLPRARRPVGRLRLRGADDLVRRRAAGGPRPLLRDHAGGPRVPPGSRPRPRDVRGVSARARDHLRAGASVLPRGRATDRPPPAPAGAALSRLGGPQRLARTRAEHARRRLHRDPRRHRDRGVRRPRRRGYRAHVHRDGARVLAGTVSGAHPRGPRRVGREPGQRRQVGACGACAGHSLAHS